jgi:hypothetical protein
MQLNYPWIVFLPFFVRYTRRLRTDIWLICFDLQARHMSKACSYPDLRAVGLLRYESVHWLLGIWRARSNRHRRCLADRHGSRSFVHCLQVGRVSDECKRIQAEIAKFSVCSMCGSKLLALDDIWLPNRGCHDLNNGHGFNFFKFLAMVL